MKNGKLFLVMFTFLSFCVLFPLGEAKAYENTMSNNFEVDGIKVEILADNNKEKIVKTDDGLNVYIVNYNKQDNTHNIETYDNNNNLLSVENINFDKESGYLKSNTVLSDTTQDISTFNTLVPIGSNGLLDDYGYRMYKYGTSIMWFLYLTPTEYKNTAESRLKNKDDLMAFKASVDSFMSNKDQLVAKIGGGVVVTLATLWLTPDLTWSKFLAVLLTTVSAAIAYAEGKAIYNAYQDSKTFYSRTTTVVVGQE
ncbi:MAG: geobacillin-26 family protein [Solibacillus sp.]